MARQTTATRAVRAPAGVLGRTMAEILFRSGVYLMLLTGTVLTIFPYLWMLSASFKARLKITVNSLIIRLNFCHRSCAGKIISAFLINGSSVTGS